MINSDGPDGETCVLDSKVARKTYSTAEAAAAVGISRQTLQAWINGGKCRAPKLQVVGKVRVRVWAQVDVDRLRAVKKENYWRKAKKAKRSPRLPYI